MPSVLVLNGPNLNLLGTRQPEVYGSVTLSDLEQLCVAHGASVGVNVETLQSNHEGVLLDAIHGAKGVHDGIALNAGAYTHSSIALMDAILSVEIPTVEVHLSNVHARESFRQTSYISKAVLGQISGFGSNSYILAIDALVAHIGKAA